jgi:hypothetical protein
MARTKISEFSATPANNTDIDSINIAEGCAPSGINDAIRELMAQLKDFQTGAVGDSFNGPVGTSTAAAGAFTTLSASSTATLSGLTASTALALDASKNIVSVTNTGTGSNVLATSPTLVTPILGTPTSATLTNATGLPISTGVSGLGTGVATFLATPSSANLAAALTDETGSGANVFATSPTLVTPILGTPTSATLTNATGLPLTTGVTGTLPTANGGTNLTSFTSGGVVYASSSSALATGSALTFDGTSLDLGTVGAKVNFATTSSATRNFIGLSADGYSLEMVTQRGALQPLSYKQDFGAGHIWSISGSEIFRATSSSLYTASGINVGIGTSSPLSKLQVAANTAIAWGVGASATYGAVTIGSASTSTSSLFVNTATVNTGYASGLAVDGTYSSPISTINLKALGIYSGGGYGGQLAFWTSSDTTASQKMLLDPAGNLGLGVTPVNAYTGLSYKNIELPKAALGSFDVTGSRPILQLKSNAYYDSAGSVLFIGNGYATQYLTDSGTHAWYTSTISNSSGAGAALTFTQAMTLDASGNLMVGSTSSSAIANKNIDVNGTGDAAFVVRVGGTTTSYLYSTAGTTILGTASSIPLAFNTNNAERARITSGGYFKASNGGSYFDSAASYHELRVTANTGDWATVISHAGATASAQYGLRIELTGDPNTTSPEMLYCSGASTLRMSVRSNGGIANYSANNVNLSDRREKTNFAPATSYLDKICAIPVQTFNYIDQNMETDGGLTLGVVAQDVQAVAPELVMESNWASKDEEPKMRLSIYQTDLQYALMKALQELKAEFDAYKASHP